MTIRKVPVGNFFIGEGEPLTVICGPCVIEDEQQVLQAAETLKNLFHKRKSNLIFKASYDKANRSSHESFRGPGLDEGMRILEKVQKEFALPVLTDVHSPEEAKACGRVFEVIQIPAFLCRQTDLIIAAASSQAVINVKKGQFMAPLDMKNVINKIHSQGNEKIILTERGVSFGYNNLVCDMRSIPLMQKLGCPVCFDATHSVQLPGGKGDSSGGEREFVAPLARAAIAAGANSLFIEAHQDPEQAKSDGSNMLNFKDLPKLLDVLEEIYAIVQNNSKS
ncbi:2-dehydro-3-deoxyphosphooctonate aldolase [Chlamydiales bacterium STE3]|nr:2-dehydro-3-deoxyphosphooctonate aldolase [Chlamydiales bacterium STE3]